MRISLIMIFCLFLSSCIINISLWPEEEPLREQLIEGTGKAKILLIPLTGMIREDGRDSHVSLVKEMLQMAEKDPDIKGLILRIDSPGGTVNASDVIYHEIRRFRDKKKIPVYASIDGLGASGAYYIAMACDRVYATPSSITGGIGVIAMKFNIEKLMSKIGIQHEVVKSGDKKDSWSPFRPSSPEEKDIFQKIIDELHTRFLSVIQENRKELIKSEDLKTLADGRVYTAEQALKAKLIDKIGYMDDIIEDIKERGIKDIRLIRYYKPGTYRPTVYSESDINLSLNINKFPGQDYLRFLYLWIP
ncbi:MAG: signal peptide peptidase SppA [Thermodesulfovibrionales bacterium]|nr:signal peptide peptidase SppA [Thermodesulfovibrionales bacterium]